VTAVPHGDGPFTYLWDTGATSAQITRVMGEQPQTSTVTVTDTRDSHSETGAVAVYPEPCSRLRSRIAAIDGEIAYLQQQLKHAAGDEKRDIVAQLRTLNSEKADAKGRLRDLGCA
jgi:hypothetical protein